MFLNVNRCLNQFFRAYLHPRQTTVVTLTVYTKTTTGNQFQDHITFSVNGPELVHKTVILSVNDEIYDDESPHMWHTFTSDCTDHLIGDCEDGSWTIEVTAQDRESGMILIYLWRKTKVF